MWLLAAALSPVLFAQTPVPSFIVTSTAGTATGTCTNQSAQGATPDSNCTVYAAFQAVTALNNTSTSSYTPTITFAPALYGKTITMTVSSTVTGNVALAGPGAGANAITLNGNGYLVGGSLTTFVTFLQQLAVSNTTISGLTFEGFSASTLNGAVLDATSTATACNIGGSSGPITLTNDIFMDNWASGYPGPSGNSSTGCGGFGGVVYTNGTITITGSTFESNQAAYAGGAVYTAGGGSISNSTFTENKVFGEFGANPLAGVNSGGAVYSQGSLNVTNSSFQENSVILGNSTYGSASAVHQGGGALYQGGSGTISNCYFGGNFLLDGDTPGSTGDIVWGGAVVTGGPIQNSGFEGNLINTENTVYEQAQGGAVYAFGAGNIISTVFDHNQVMFAGPSGSGQTAQGAALYLAPANTSSITLSNDTFTLNSMSVLMQYQYNGTLYTGAGSGQAGAIYIAPANASIQVNLINDTIVNNSLTSTPLASTGGVYVASGTVTAVNTVISGNSALNSYADEYGVTDGGNNYIDTSATSTCSANCAPLLSTFGLYGGPGLVPTGSTPIPVGTVIPLPGSPLLAAGNATYSALPTTDDRGYPRTTTYKGATHVDIGATEANYTLEFVQPPTRTLVNANISPAPTVLLLESGVARGTGANTAPGGYAGGSLVIGASAGTPSISSVATTTSGLESLTVSLPTVETADTLIASAWSSGSPAVQVASTSSATFDVISGYILAFTAMPMTPQTVGSTTAQSVTVAIEGSDGSATTQTGSITLTVTGPNGYSATYGPTAASASTGSATFATAALTTPGTYIYTASSSGFTSVVTTQMVLTAQQAAPLVFVAGSGSVGSLNSIGSVSTTAVPGGGIGVAIDASGNAWSLGGSGSLAKFNPAGALATTYSGLGLSGATALAIDGKSQVWVANGNGSLTVVSNAGAVVSTTQGSTNAGSSGVAIDLSGNVWISNGAAGTVDEVIGGAAPVAPLAVGVTGVSTGTEP